MSARLAIQRIASVARKEVLHMRRDPSTVFFALMIPIIELLLLGYAIDTNVRHIRTVIFDQARTQESVALLQSFVNTEDFDIVGEVFSDHDLYQAIVSGRAMVAIKIPEDYSRRLQAGQTAQVLVLVDGSESRVAGEALNVSNAIALRESLQLLLGDRQMPVDARPRVLFNPDTRSANFFIPGLLVVICQMMSTMLTANAIVREKENGTLEQLFMTPVRAREVMLGKMTPYLGLTVVEFLGITLLMRTVFQVPINGSFLTLCLISFPFLLATLGLGLFISTRANSRDAAMQMTMGTVLPSIFLSGYIFPIDSMPWAFRQLSYAIPTTWLVDAARGVILRGAGWRDLWSHAVMLCGMAIAVMTLSTIRFQKKVS